MTSLVKRKEKVEKNKRVLFMGVSGIGVATMVAVNPIIGGLVLAAGGYLGWDWFKFRAKNGMRF